MLNETMAEVAHQPVQYSDHISSLGSEMKLSRNYNAFPHDLQTTLSDCFKSETFTDVHIYCKRNSETYPNSNPHEAGSWVSVKANQSVLAAVSPYMKRILSSVNTVDYCIVMDGFSYEEVCSMVQYAYTGEVDPHLQGIVDITSMIETFELKFNEENEQFEAEEDISDAEDEEWSSTKEYSPDVTSHQINTTKSTPKKQGSDGERSGECNSSADRTCDFCGKNFARPALMLNHRRIHTGEKPFVCNICDKSYREKSHLTRHQRSHSDNTRPFRCEVCDKSFANHFYLTQHSLTHSGYKRLLCSTCGYQCFQASDLKKHMRTHTGEKPYVCPVEFCGKAFTQKVSCIKHQQALHKNVDTPSQSLPSFESEMLD